MIPRYSRPEMSRLWTEESRFRHWLRVEIEVCRVLAERGEIPAAAFEEIQGKADFDLEEIHELEKTTHHDVVAFLGSVARHVGPAGRFVHLGLTSSDVVDTALALQLREAGGRLLEGVDRLLDALRKRAEEHRATLMVGRTHGMHSEPTSFGLKMALWYAEMRRNRRRLKAARRTVSVGKISGAVGTFAHLPPEVEEAVCRRLELSPAPITTQVIQRDRIAEFLAALAITAASLEKFATEIRNLQRTDIAEVEEPFRKGQRGSSSMPHKRNPVKCEQIAGLARLVRGYLTPALENVTLWHERDISHSSVERVILPDATILLDYMLDRFRFIMEGLEVREQRMRENLGRTGGMVASQRILLLLVRKGSDRDEAHGWVQAATRTAQQAGREFRDVLREDPRISALLDAKEIDSAFDLDSYIAHTDRIFDRVFREDG